MAREEEATKAKKNNVLEELHIIGFFLQKKKER
jgi:hypothetical protein